mmetsp:Transcript_16105/g.41397  ORF Transcript_16105/g.41397 Transcript_16105/m.41397 type:complete len:100 (-) Transcript_16105:217-516(-)
MPIFSSPLDDDIDARRRSGILLDPSLIDRGFSGPLANRIAFHSAARAAADDAAMPARRGWRKVLGWGPVKAVVAAPKRQVSVGSLPKGGSQHSVNGFAK